MAYHEAQGGKDVTRGLAVLDEGLQNCHASLDKIFSTLGSIECKLYAPKPTALDPPSPSNPAPSIENSLNHLANRLRQLEALTSTILHG